jgi:DNA-binding IscR family transcriptional regulator
VNTNPVVIRRLLGLLREAGYVESRGGVGGGWLLKGNPDQITLFDVLRAVDPQGDAFSLHKSEPNPECPVGRHIQGVLSEVYDEASRAMEGRLAKTSISGILGSVQKRMGP